MITLRIDNREEALSEINQQWIHQQINRRREDGLLPSVIIRIMEPEINIILATPGSANSYNTSSRRPNEKEQRILDLWSRLNLNRADFSSGNLVAFIQQIDRYL
jgi:hypothetical protein